MSDGAVGCDHRAWGLVPAHERQVDRRSILDRFVHAHERCRRRQPIARSCRACAYELALAASNWYQHTKNMSTNRVYLNRESLLLVRCWILPRPLPTLSAEPDSLTIEGKPSSRVLTTCNRLSPASNSNLPSDLGAVRLKETRAIPAPGFRPVSSSSGTRFTSALDIPNYPCI